MKSFKRFIKAVFLKRWIINILTVMLFFAANYLVFTSARSLCSAYQGYSEMRGLTAEGAYIANLDPESTLDFNIITDDSTREAYEWLGDNCRYAFFTDGYIVSIPNAYDMQISIGYLNEEYYKLNPPELAQGTQLNFDYSAQDGEIPVLVGAGLAKTYPLGSAIIFTEPTSGKTLTLTVQGILKQNANHSNYYSLTLKTYCNFSILLPVNEEFIAQAGADLRLNGLMDLIIPDADEQTTAVVGDKLQSMLGLKFNFFTQEENNKEFAAVLFQSLIITSALTLILLAAAVVLSVRNTSCGIRSMDTALNNSLPNELSGSRLKRMLWGYFGIYFIIAAAAVFVINACYRYGFWRQKVTLYATFGLFGTTGTDWLSLAAALLVDAVAGMIIVNCIAKKIK